MEKHESIQILFERYLADTCTPEQVRELLEYFNLKADKGQLLHLIQAHFETPESTSSNQKVLEEVHQKLLEQIALEEPPIKTFWSSAWLRVAAIWLILALAGGGAFYLLTNSFHQPSQKQYTHTPPASLQILRTGIGERKRIVLQDSSVIWLNALSSLTYPSSFSPDKREVQLEGEAYFEIFRDEHRPFTIRSGHLQTTVLGTSFNIKAYQNNPKIAVTVLSGKVEVKAAQTAIQLDKNQQATYVSGQMHKEVDLDARNATAWKNGQLQFRNSQLGEVIQTLERMYPVRITYAPALRNCPVYADFDVDTPVESVMEMLAVSVGGKVTDQGNTQFYLEGNCKK